MYDPVNKPEHYNMGSIECIDYIRQVLGLEGYIAYCRGNAIKYQHRAEYKGKYLEDMRKHNWYSQKAIEAIEELNASKNSTNT
jgi:hypothetical protein